MKWHNPWAFILLLPVLAAAILHFYYDRRKRGTIRFSDVTHLKHVPRSLGMRLRLIVPILRILVLGCIVVGLARPQYGWKDSRVTSSGIDIIQALDVSDSMQQEDMNRRSRLDAAKDVIAEFIDGRKSDRIGCVVFGRISFSLCPLTLDHGVLKQFLSRVESWTADGRQTAIGMGLANSIRQLEQSKAKSKVIILLTDGVNNAGEIEPFTAAEMAKALGIRVYTIGVGSQGRTLMPGAFGMSYTVGGGEFDEATLRRIADITGAEFFHATDGQKLKAIYDEIDGMEKSDIEEEVHQYYDELMVWAVVPAFVLLLLEILLGYTRFRKLP